MYAVTDLFIFLFCFQALTANIVYFKPEDPIGYMMKEIEVIKKEKAATKSAEKK